MRAKCDDLLMHPQILKASSIVDIKVRRDQNININTSILYKQGTQV